LPLSNSCPLARFATRANRTIALRRDTPLNPGASNFLHERHACAAGRRRPGQGHGRDRR